VLMDRSQFELASVVDASMAQAIVKVREGTAKVTPGYDGVYGQLVLGVDAPKAKVAVPRARVQQTNMMDFW
jgi:PHP family Zn ribbon phosphoesterase